MYTPEDDGSLIDAAPNVSPFLRRPVRSRDQVAATRDADMRAGLLMSVRVLRDRVRERQDAAATEAGRIACDRVIAKLGEIERDLVFGGPL